MKVVILGAGVIGTTAAWYLTEAGHEVTVLDRQPGPALETSFANAGEVSPGYASPWAAPVYRPWILRHPIAITRPSASCPSGRVGTGLASDGHAARLASIRCRPA